LRGVGTRQQVRRTDEVEKLLVGHPAATPYHLLPHQRDVGGRPPEPHEPELGEQPGNLTQRLGARLDAEPRGTQWPGQGVSLGQNVALERPRPREIWARPGALAIAGGAPRLAVFLPFQRAPSFRSASACGSHLLRSTTIPT